MKPKGGNRKQPAGPHGFVRKTRKNNKEGLSSIKKRIRDLGRTLKKGTPTAAMRVEVERKLKALEYEYGEKYIDKHEHELSSKYRSVKHFELKKAERKVRRAQKALDAAETDEEKKKHEQELEESKIDQLYIEYYPKTMAYISLYAEEKEQKNKERNTKTRQELKDKIKKIRDTHGDFDEISREYRKKLRNELLAQGKIFETTGAENEMEATESTSKKDTAAANDDTMEDDFFE
ncbi:hypothetical protein O0I10_009185 [Lichtheimia ornata]|uniref:rRNA-processing protein EFG1 n=1 Tax=Lichtheimia ornata TaxID=688661 RepID=A0AAD7UXL7_9FUNG|nr:uncharacterized protein O0I10_009185 [Lichtheimia ornata]KAJ8655150.1 hypothetical protein O0I10_009185 [Lichtheimia ornata]